MRSLGGWVFRGILSRLRNAMSPRAHGGAALGPGLFAAALLLLSLEPARALVPDKPLNQYLFRRWGVEHGLPHPVVRAVVQTRDGYVWAATEFGLARFNGERFVVLGTEELPRPAARCLLAGSDGALWVGINGGGVARYSQERFQLLTLTNGLPGLSVVCLFEDSRHRIWVGGAQGAAWIDPRQPLAATAVPFPAGVSVLSISEDDQGRLWFGTVKGLWGPFAPGFPVVQETPGAPRQAVRALCPDGRGGMWLGTDEGLQRFFRGTFGDVELPPGAKRDPVAALYRDSQEVLWVATARGVRRRRETGWIDEQPAPALRDTAVQAFLSDREHNLWIAGDDGLHILQDAKFTTYSIREGLMHEMVNGLAEDSSGTLWLGTFNGGLYSLKEGRPRQVEEIPRTMNVTAVLCDRSGRVWAGARRDGLYRRDTNGWRQVSPGTGLADNFSALCEDTAGRVWTGSAQGLGLWQEGRVVPVALPALSTNQGVRFILQADDGLLWVAGNDGLYSLGPTGTNRFGLESGLPGTLVYCLAQDHEGRLWAGTDKGLACRLADGWHAWPPRMVLGRYHVFWLADDGAGHLWYTTPWTLFRVSISDLLAWWQDPDRPVEQRRFDHADGLISTECLGGRQDAGRRARDGRIWIPTRRGLAVIDPLRMPVNTTPPPVRLERILADGQPQPLQPVLVLPQDTRLVEFHYAGLSFTAPENVRYRYQLSGVDGAWVQAETRRVAAYANLKPGPYRFQVAAANNDGIWNPEGALLNFTIPPRFYQTAWFYPVALSAATAAALGWHFARLRRLRRQKESLLALVQERTQSLETQMRECISLEQRLLEARKMEAVGRLAGGVAHYFNNLLAVIQGYASLLEEDAAKHPEVARSIPPIQEAAQRAAGLVRQLLAFSRLQGPALQSLDLNQLVSRHARALRELGDPAFRVIDDLEAGLPRVAADPQGIEHILHQLAANARDAMPRGGILTFRTQSDPAPLPPPEDAPGGEPRPCVALVISDTGCGMTPEVLSRVFEPFFTTKEVGHGTGLGLAAVHGIVRRHQGTIDVESAPGQGTTLKIRLPAAGA